MLFGCAEEEAQLFEMKPAAEMILNGMRGAIKAKTVTYDFERLMEGATLIKCSEFGQAMIDHMDA